MDYFVSGLWRLGFKSLGDCKLTNPTSQVYYDSAAKQNRLVRELKELVQYRDLIWQMTIRNITVRYKRSFLGVFWTLLEPLLTMMVMAFVFTALLSRSIPHFPVYLFCGLIVWGYFAGSTNSAMRDFVATERLISRVYLPQSVFVIVAITTGLVNFMIEIFTLLIITLVMMGSISLYIPTLILPIFILTIFNLGLGLILAPLSAYFSDINTIYNILLRLLLYLSAIFYPVDILPDWLQKIVNLNPVYQFIHVFRNPVYYGTPIPLDSLLYISIWAVGLITIGVFLFTQLADDIAKRT
jgi:ABC-type polysaccharide/polyol phosphate export permease